MVSVSPGNTVRVCSDMAISTVLDIRAQIMSIDSATVNPWIALAYLKPALTVAGYRAPGYTKTASAAARAGSEGLRSCSP